MHVSNVWAAAVADGVDQLWDRWQVSEIGSRLGLREIEALTLVKARPRSSSEWLREHVGLSQSGTVRLVDRLTSQGLMRRCRTGSREVALVITPQGDSVLRDWSAARDEVADGLLATLSPTERATLVGLLAKALRGTTRDRSAADRTCRTCDWRACEPDCPVDASATL